jgi:hypothetical protein
MLNPRTVLGALAAVTVLMAPAAQAQLGSSPGTFGGMGTSTSTTTQYLQNQQQASEASPAPDCDSAVSFLDSAAPQSQVKLLIDLNYDDRQPSRAEYLFPRSGVPGGPGWVAPESRVDWQELSSYIEYAFIPNFSAFLQATTRWVNPTVNDNDWGFGDVNLGMKYAFIQTGGLALTGEVKGTIPTRTGPGLSVYHYSVEPGFLFYLRPIEWLSIEGQLMYWLPFDGTSFSGSMVDYGLGLGFGERSYSDFWFTPVIEMRAWTLVGGQETVTFPDGSGAVKSTAGETIANAMAGIRFGFGDNGDIYVGGGHSVTGDAWQHFFARIEFRVRF